MATQDMHAAVMETQYNETFSIGELRKALGTLAETLAGMEGRAPPSSFAQAASQASALTRYCPKMTSNARRDINDKVLRSTLVRQSGQSKEKSVVTAHQNGMAIIRDLETGHKYEAIQISQGNTLALDGSPEGSMIAAGGLACTVDIYPINEAIQQDLNLQRSHHDFNYNTDLHHDHQKLYLGDGPASGGGTTEDHANFMASLKWASKGPKTIQVQRELAMIDPEQALRNATFNPRVAHPARYMPRGYEAINNWCASFVGHQSSVTAVRFSGEHTLLSGSADGAAMVWDVDSGTAQKLYRGHDGSVNALCPLTEQTFISCGSDGYILMWDTRTSGVQLSFQSSVEAPVELCERYVDNISFVSAGRSHIDVFDARAGGPLINYVTQNHQISSLGVSASARLLITGSATGTCVILDSLKGEWLGEIRAHEGLVTGTYFEGSNIVTCGRDGTVKQWTHKPRK